MFYEQTGVAYRKTISDSITSPPLGIPELLEAVQECVLSVYQFTVIIYAVPENW